MAKGQNWTWSDQFKSTNFVEPLDLAVDINNNIYVTGTYDISNLTIQGLTISNHGDKDGFICKFNKDGNIQWLVSIGGIDREIPVSIKIINNQLYVTGDFRSNTVYFTPTNTLTLTNNFDTFLAVYDLNGNFIKATNIFYGNDIQRVKGMVFDSQENSLLFAGQFKVQLKYFDGTSVKTVLPRGSSGRDHFVIKTDLNGDVQDTVFFTTNSTNTIMKSINQSLNDGYYIGGDLFNKLNFTSTDFLIGNSITTADAFVVKLDKNLDFLWARKGGGVGFDHVNSSVSDKYGNIYLAGKCETIIRFDSTATLTSHTIPDIGAQDLYIAKYNKLGNLQWVNRKGDVGNDDAFGLIERDDLIQFCGNISGTVVFNQDTLRSSSSADVNTGFAVFDSKGNEIAAQGIGGTGTDIGEAITFSKLGNTIIGGYFASPNIVIGDSIYLNPSGTGDGFIASYYYPMNAVFTSVKSLVCNDANNGELIGSPYFGVGPYNYAWSPNVTSYIDSFAYNLPTGTYSVTITDSRDSTAFTSITLTEPSAINLSSIKTNVSCHPYNGAGNDGAVNLTITGGTITSGYTYEWAAIFGSGANATSEDQSALTTGIYSVVVRDDNLCEASDTFTISQPNPITFGQSLVTDETIPPALNGAINLSTSGGTPANTYAWTGPGGFNSTSEDISSLGAGSYSVQTTDSKSCIGDTSFFVTNDTLLIAFISDKTDVDCKGANTGSATVSMQQGTGPFTFAWRNNLGDVIDGNNPTILNVPADLYFVHVIENSSGRFADASVQINEPLLPFTLSIAGSNIDCFGNLTGVADLTVSGGNLPYAFSWSNGGSTEDLTEIGAGNYKVTVTDNKACIANDEITLTSPPALDMNITIDQPILCYGELTGILTATATGGTGTKTYIWNDPGNQTAQTATNIQAGTYEVTATDQNGCPIVKSVQLTEPSELILTENHQNVSCNGLTGGIINLTVNGGSPSYNYDWSNGQISQDISGLAVDTFSVIVTDAHNCNASLSVEITQSPPVTIQTIGLTDASCFDETDGEISITASGGSGNYQYSINGGTNYFGTSTFTGIGADDYTVMAKDNTDCFSLDSIVSISQPDEIIFQDIAITSASCFGLNDASIDISPGGGAGPPYQYSINNGTDYSINSLFDSLPAITYNLRIKDAGNCQSADSIVSVNHPAEIILSSQTVTDISCNGLTDGSITIVVSGASSDYLYSIDNGLSYLSNNGNFSNLSEGSYQIKVKNPENCEQSGSLLNVVEPLILTIDTTNITHALGDINGSIQLEAEGGTSPYIFILDHADADSMSAANGKFNDLLPGDYTAYASDINLCYSDTIGITILQSSKDIVIYDAISPNNDGKNDVWHIGNIGLYPNCSVTIMNTWGSKVFTSNGYATPWDGMYNNKELPSGTYYYIIDLGDGSESYSGPVSIIR
jgi:gliding motility-associated-like protein